MNSKRGTQQKKMGSNSFFFFLKRTPTKKTKHERGANEIKKKMVAGGNAADTINFNEKKTDRTEKSWPQRPVWAWPFDFLIALPGFCLSLVFCRFASSVVLPCFFSSARAIIQCLFFPFFFLQTEFYRFAFVVTRQPKRILVRFCFVFCFFNKNFFRDEFYDFWSFF